MVAFVVDFGHAVDVVAVVVVVVDVVGAAEVAAEAVVVVPRGVANLGRTEGFQKTCL